MSKVLLVDDDELLLRSPHRTLTAKGYEVALARGPEQALEPVTAAAVVVSDIHRPGYSGIDFLKELRRPNCDTPVFLMTGSPELETAMAATEHGAVHYLLKPFGMDTLKDLIERALVNHVPRRGDLKLLGDLGSLSARFDDALAKMFMVFQPIVSVAQRKPIAYEALLRTDAVSPGVAAVGVCAARRPRAHRARRSR